MFKFNYQNILTKYFLLLLLILPAIPSLANVNVDSLLRKAASSNTDNSSIYREIINTISNTDTSQQTIPQNEKKEVLEKYSNMHGTTLGLLALELAEKGELDKARQYYQQAKSSIQDSMLLQKLQLLLEPEREKENVLIKESPSLESSDQPTYPYSKILATLILMILSILTFYVFMIKKEYTVEEEVTAEINQPTSPPVTPKVQSPEVPFFLEELKANQIDWPQFLMLYEKEFPEFINNFRRLDISHTPNNFKHAICIRMNLSLKETASILGVSIGSVKAARNRLKKRLNLKAGDSIKEFILTL